MNRLNKNNKRFYRPHELNEYQLHYQTPRSNNSTKAVAHSYFEAKTTFELAHPRSKVTGFSILKQNV